MSKALKIGFVALGFPPHVGGTELYNVEYARRLHERGHDLRVVTWQPDAEDIPAAQVQAADAALPFEVKRLPFARHNKKISPNGIRKTLKEWGSEVAFISRGSKMMTQVVRAAAKQLPVVLSMHELREKHRDRGFFGRWRIRRRYALESAKLVTVNSLDTRQRLANLGLSDDSLVTVYPGCDTSAFQPDPEQGRALRQQQGFGDRPIMLTVSRLAANKGHSQVLALMPELLTKHPELLYVIVGKGGERSALEQQVEQLGLSGHVQFTGLIRDTRPYYQACDVFVMVSTPQNKRANAGEGFGISYVEAGSCGKPVIASSSGGGKEIVEDGETGYVVPPHEPQTLSQRLHTLLSKPELCQRFGQAARERVKIFDWNQGVVTLEQALSKA